jgi:hypothetical protein
LFYICLPSNQFSFSIIGEEATLSIKVGAEAADPSTEDVILVRGVSDDVDRAVKEILKIVEDAKNDEIVNSHVSFTFDLIMKRALIVVL